MTDITQHSLWPKLGLRQQEFLAAYVRLGGNKKAAQAAVFPEMTPELAKDSANRILRRPKIRQILSDHHELAASTPSQAADQSHLLTDFELSLLYARWLRSGQLNPRQFELFSERYLSLTGHRLRTGLQVDSKPKPKDSGKEELSIDEIVLAYERKRREQRMGTDG